MHRKYGYRKVRSHFVTYVIKTNAWVRWFRAESEASRWTRLVNAGMPTSFTGMEPDWRNR